MIRNTLLKTLTVSLKMHHCCFLQILLSVMSLVAEPNINSPANVDAAKLWRDNREEFIKVRKFKFLGLRIRLKLCLVSRTVLLTFQPLFLDAIILCSSFSVAGSLLLMILLFCFAPNSSVEAQFTSRKLPS